MKSMIQDEQHTVLILDDDRAILSGLERLLSAKGYKVKLFSESGRLIEYRIPREPACLILDHELGDGINGLQVHAELQRKGWMIPTVFLTGHWNVQSVVSAMRSGADGFLTKPFDPAELVQAVDHALHTAIEMRQEDYKAAEARAKASHLTVRELEIVKLVVAGLLNKEIADQLNLAQVTVKVHRGRAMQKLGAGNPADLARIASLAGVVS